MIYHFDLSLIRGRSPIAHIAFFLFTVNLSEIYVKSTEDMRERYFLNRRRWLLVFLSFCKPFSHFQKLPQRLLENTAAGF